MSLKRVNDWRVEENGWIFKKWRVYVTRTRYFTFSDDEFQRIEEQSKTSTVVRIVSNRGRVLWWAGGEPFWDAINRLDKEERSRMRWWMSGELLWAESILTAEAVELLVWDQRRRQVSKFNRLQKVRAREEDPTETRRNRIPDEVRAFVWKRDEGRCVQCGAQEELEFDHIIPVAKGGGNAIDNIQILCRDCNQQKSDSII